MSKFLYLVKNINYSFLEQYFIVGFKSSSIQYLGAIPQLKIICLHEGISLLWNNSKNFGKIKEIEIFTILKE